MTAETIGEDVRTAARSILIFKELNIFLSVHALLELAVDAVFSVRNTAAFLKYGVNIFFGNRQKQRLFRPLLLLSFRFVHLRLED